ncbi:MAG: YbaB/EbfC family nucleoid-associated protein [Methylococcus sp.]|nr:YbaB/EbfC family nucleoid-associated protein [Methylococcus sp.]
MKNPLANLMQQAQRFQESFQQTQEEIAATEVHAESGGGLVKIRMTGKREVLKIDIDPSLLQEDRAVLEDLIAAAFNDGVRRVAKLKQEKMANLTGGLGIPPGFNLPF